jgi:hypothetical protein
VRLWQEVTPPPARLWLGVNAALYRIDRLFPPNGVPKVPQRGGISAQRGRSQARRASETGATVRLRPMHDGGQISPELALVDPALAERAQAPSGSERLSGASTSTCRDAWRSRRGADRGADAHGSLRRGGLGGERSFSQRSCSQSVLLRVASSARGELLHRESGSRPRRPRCHRTVAASDRCPQALGGHRTAAASDRRRGPKSKSTRRQQRAARATWAANVLGVAARVDRPGVTLVWQRPANSDHVVILRSPATRSHDVVVYRGRARSFRDDPPLPCTGYRYTIVNYDRKGHRATGVPTSVVTQGCA